MSEAARNDQERVGGVFNRAASTYDRIGPRVVSYFGQRLVDVAQLAPGAQVLDVAAGRGAVLFPAAKRIGPVGHVVGIDLSEEMVHETAADLHRAGLQNAEMRQMDAENLLFEDGAFDQVLCGFSLWFFPDPHAALLGFSRVLKRPGRVGITTWAEDCPALHVAREVLRPFLPAGSTGRLRQGVPQFDSPAQLEGALRRAHFERVQVLMEDNDFVYADEDEWWASLWSSGMRGQLEKLTPAMLKQARFEASERVRPFTRQDGVHLAFRALFAFGTKPA